VVDHSAPAQSAGALKPAFDAPHQVCRRPVPSTIASDLNTAFAALSDITRRAVIQALLDKPRRAGELAQCIDMSPPALSRHLRVLRKARLVVEEGIEADARVRVYRLDPAAFSPVRDWLGQIEALWEEQLLAFKQHAERPGRARRSKP
jgi:DNA-binding transcriptional ArsR family regulator